MTDLPTYRGYAGSMAFSPEDAVFFGRVLGITDVVGFHADTADEIVAALHEAVDDCLETRGRIATA